MTMTLKNYRITLVFDDGTNCQSIRPAKDAQSTLGQLLQEPSVRKHQLQHSLADFKVEELPELPVPREDRFWLERRDDGVYVLIDEQRKRALTFEFGRLQETDRYTDFHGEKPPVSTVNTDFLMEAHLWLLKFHPALVGMAESSLSSL